MENDNPSILVVDDDPGLRDLLRRYLREQGFDVFTAGDGRAMDAEMAQRRIDLVILDLMLPGEDGLAIARRLRSDGSIPIIMLSAKGEDIDRIIGLEVGADDYLPKPFNPRELLARIRAVTRRHDPARAEQASETPEVIKFDVFNLDLTTHRLFREGEQIPLTGSEFSLLRVFAQHPNRVLSRDKLIDLLKGYERSPYDRSIDIRVARLRRKLEPDPADPQFIRTIWGEGYLFSPQGKAYAG